MRRLPAIAVLVAILFTLVSPAHAQTETAPLITFPQAGQVLQGVVTLTGTSALPDFASAEISFAYAQDPTNTWFVIASTNQPVQAGTLAVWDTTQITDGDYSLRLRVILQSGTWQETILTGLQVRNYTPLDTPTPTQTPVIPATFTPVPTLTLVPTPFLSPTPLPANPVTLTVPDVTDGFLSGALVAVLILALFGLLLRFRRR